jgi:hypothetical protein
VSQSVLTADASNGEVFELQTNNAGKLAVRAAAQIIHDDVKAPGITFDSGNFSHVTTDLAPFGVDDTWAVQCTFITNDVGFDDCVIGQPHWDAGVGDIHVYNFGPTFTTTTPITVRCIATKVA